MIIITAAYNTTETDLRDLAWEQRRERLQGFASGLDPERFDVSQLIEAKNFDALEEMRA